MNRHEFEQEHGLRNLPADQVIREYYPKRGYWWRDRQNIFAVRYFNREGRELAYWLPDMASGRVFDPPRVWSPAILESVGIRPK